MPESRRAHDSLPTGAMAFLFTDIEDSTRLWQVAPEPMRVALARHDAILRRAIEAAGGRVFKTTGDAFHATFDDPPRALHATLEIQRALCAEAWPKEAWIRVRMALEVGTAHSRDGDYFGPPLNTVARLLSVARGGQTLLTGLARDTLGSARIDGAQLESHGFYRLKGVEAPVEIFELGVRDRAPFAPPADTGNVYRVFRTGDLWQPVRNIRHNLPAERDAFIGRSSELQALARRLDADTRLITVAGFGGTGKTRFVRRYGRAWLGDWPGGVYFCDLSEARSLEGIHSAVAFALGVPLGKAEPGEQIGHAIAGRGRCLVILDNFEQVAEHAPATLGRWVDQTTEASFVATSRERLHLAGEEVFVLDPLPLADEAIELFAVRARAQRSDFALGEANRAAVAAVVRLLDGLPLAIELAAARIRVLSPAQIVERMKERFRLLAGARGAAARQATLRAAIDWSWDLLAPWEQAALAQCSVFDGSFTLEAAESVLELSRWPEAPPAIDAVQALVDKSLLRTWNATAPDRYAVDEPYFGMYLSIHEFAAEKLQACGPGERRAAEERHGRYFASFGSEAALEALFRHDGIRRRRALRLELDNVVTACKRAAARGDGATAVAAYRAAWETLERQGPFAPGVALGVQVLALDGIDASQRALACVTEALALRRVGRVAETEPLLEQALALASESGDRHVEALASSQLGYVHDARGRIDEALAAMHAALAIRRELGHRRLEGEALGNIANLLVGQGRLDEARELFEQALAIHRELGNRRAEGGVIGGLAVVHHDQGRMEEAQAHYQAATDIMREVGDRFAESVVLSNLGTLHNDLGRLPAAREVYEAALAIHRELGDREGVCVTLGNLGKLSRDQGRTDEARLHYATALQIAREMGKRREEGIALGGLAGLHRDRGEAGEARARYEEALAIHREIGNRRFEGEVLANLAELLAEEGRPEQAREALRIGEALLREIDDPLDLAKLLCIRGCVEIGAGELGAALAALAEAESLASVLAAAPDSELCREIVKLRFALEQNAG